MPLNNQSSNAAGSHRPWHIWLALACATFVGGVAVAVALRIDSAMPGPASNDFQVEVMATRINPTHNSIEVDAVMSGNGLAVNNQTGTYKVPMHFRYPQNPTSCNGTGIVDIVNYSAYFVPGFAYDFDTKAVRPYDIGNKNEDLPGFAWPHLWPHALLEVGDDFLFGQRGGYVYADALVDPIVIETWRSKNSLPDQSWHIDSGAQYAILRDTSAFLRDPAAHLAGQALSPKPCAASDVLGYGFSYTSAILEGMMFKKVNSRLAEGNSVFDQGLVFEGSTMGDGPGSGCVTFPPESGALNCNGSTPRDQGKYISSCSMLGLEEFSQRKWNCVKVRSSASSSEWYRAYEYAGAAHGEVQLIDAKSAGFRHPDNKLQNNISWRPLLRANIAHLTDWVKGTSVPPKDAYVEVDANQRLVYGTDGNPNGGVRSPQVRTVLPDSASVGAPLGISHSVLFNDLTLSDFDVIAGVFTPYTELSGAQNKCPAYYPTRQAYVDSLTKGVDYGINMGWFLAEDRAEMIQRGMDEAAKYGAGCVPAARP